MALEAIASVVDLTLTNTKLDAQNALLTQLLALLGNTDQLEGLVGNTNTLLATQAGYLDQVETLLTTLGTYEDGVEGLLGQLGVKNDSLIAKLEQLRLLLAATLVTRSNIPASVLAGQTLAVSSNAVGLTVPGTATYAELEVISGAASGAAVRWSKSANLAPGAGTRSLGVGDTLRLRGAEMAAFKVIRDQATDASLHVEYGVDA